MDANSTMWTVQQIGFISNAVKISKPYRSTSSPFIEGTTSWNRTCRSCSAEKESRAFHFITLLFRDIGMTLSVPLSEFKSKFPNFHHHPWLRLLKMVGGQQCVWSIYCISLSQHNINIKVYVRCLILRIATWNTKTHFAGHSSCIHTFLPFKMTADTSNTWLVCFLIIFIGTHAVK